MDKSQAMIDILMGIIQSDLDKYDAEEFAKMFDDVEDEKALRVNVMFSTENARVILAYSVTNP